MTKSNFWRKGFNVAYSSQVTVYHQRKSEQELTAGTWSQMLMQRPWMGAVYCLVPHVLLNLSFSNTQDLQPGMAPSTVNWALPHQSSIKNLSHGLGHSLYRLSGDQSEGDIFSAEAPSSRMTLAYVKLT